MSDTDKWITIDEALQFSISAKDPSDVEIRVQDEDSGFLTVLALDTEGLDEIINILQAIRVEVAKIEKTGEIPEKYLRDPEEENEEEEEETEEGEDESEEDE